MTVLPYAMLNTRPNLTLMWGFMAINMVLRLRKTVAIIAAMVVMTALFAPRVDAEDQPGGPQPWQLDSARAALQDPSADVRRAALAWLSDKEVTDARFAPLLVPFLRHGQTPEVGHSAANVLIGLGPGAAGIVPDLITLLKDPDQAVRRQAAQLLARLLPGPAAVRQVGELLSNPAARDGALIFLAGIGSDAAPVAAQAEPLLRDKDPELRQNALRTLYDADAAEILTRHFPELLKDPDPEVLSLAVQARAAVPGPEAAAQLRGVLASHVPQARAAAIEVLGEMSPGPALAAQMAVLLRDPAQMVREAAGHALVSMARNGAVQSRAIARLLTDRDADVRLSALAVLGGLGAGAAGTAPQVAKLLADPSHEVRRAALDTLHSLVPAGTAFVPKLLARTRDPDQEVRLLAAQWLGNIGQSNATVAGELAALLGSSDPNARISALAALGQMGPRAAAFAPRLVSLLTDPSDQVAGSAMQTLTQLGRSAQSVAPRIAAMLRDRDSKVRQNASGALTDMGRNAAAAIPLVVQLLKDPDTEIRQIAWQTLAAVASSYRQIGEGADEHPEDWPYIEAAAEQLTSYLKPDTESSTRVLTLQVFAGMGGHAAKYVPEIAAQLKDPDADIRSMAVQVLATIAPGDETVTQMLIGRLKDDALQVRQAAMGELAEAQPKGPRSAPQLAAALADLNPDIRARALQLLDVLAASGPLQDMGVLLPLLDAAYVWRGEAADILSHAYVTRRLGPKDLILIRWLGNRPAGQTLKVGELDTAGGLAVFGAFNDVWQQTQGYPDLRRGIADRVAELARSRAWPATPALTQLENRLAVDFPDQALALNRALQSSRWHGRLLAACWVLGLHASAWLALIWAYPYWPWGRRVFFWSPWTRRLLGLGYAGALIRWVPALRQRMFVPFRAALVPEGLLGQLGGSTYFGGSEVVPEAHAGMDQQRIPLSQALGGIHGQAVLQGQPGLGKTLLLLRLAAAARHPVVFLRAAECSAGVVAAIQQKLQVRDEAYLRVLIGAGALHILVDDLDAALPGARTRVSEFLADFGGEFVLATQPTSWDAPSGARVYTLQPLGPEQIQPFLMQQWERVKDGASVDQGHYEGAVTQYGQAIRDGASADGVVNPGVLVLTNPMDAAVAAELLAHAETPQTFQLLEQRYRVMAARFLESHEREFSLRRFCEHVYEWRKSGELYLGGKGFEAEVAALAQERLLIPAPEGGAEGTRTGKGGASIGQWLFRHDKVMAFFLLPAFADQDRISRRYTHAGDERFAGVYEQLAVSLADDEEAKLHEFLIDLAVDTGRSWLLDRYELARCMRPPPGDEPAGRPGAAATPAAVSG